MNKIWPKDDSTEQSHFILLAIVVALSTMANSIVAPLLPLYARQILATPGQVGLLVSVFGITRFATQPILGMFSDRLGHRRLVQIMLALFAISGVGYGMSNSLLSLLLFRCIQAIAVGGLSVSVRSYVVGITTRENRGRVNGVISSMQNVGSLTGPVLGGLVAEWWNIHAPFYVLSLGVMVCLLVSMKLPVMQHDQLTRQHNSTKSQWPKPLILLGIIHFFEFMGLGIWLAIWPIYAVENLGWTSSMVGASFSISALASLITAPIWGRISDQYGRTVSAILGLILLILQPLSVVVLADVPLLIWPLFALAGAGGTGYFNAYFTLVGDLSPAHDVGWFQGVLGSGSQLGNSAGSLLAPILWQALSIEFALLGDVTLLTMCMALFIPLFIRERNQQITKKG